jgi:heterodisulfide reductase subunit B
MVTVCPMCQMNLDAYQNETNRYFGTKFHMPIVFFTQLMALAFGKNAKEAGFGMELTSPKAALDKIGLEITAPPSKPTKKPEGLPMPARKPKKYASGQEASE